MFRIREIFSELGLDPAHPGGQGVWLDPQFLGQLLVAAPLQVDPAEQVQLLWLHHALQFQQGFSLGAGVGEVFQGFRLHLGQQAGPPLLGAQVVPGQIGSSDVQPADGVGAGQEALLLFPEDGEGLLGQVLHQVGVRRVAAPGQQGAQIEKHGLVVGVEELVELCLAQGLAGRGHGQTLPFEFLRLV